MGKIRAVFFDVAHTLLEKPAVLPAMRVVLSRHGVNVPLDELHARHTLLMEAIEFPDRTNREFYQGFNAALVRSLGAIPTPELLDALFAASTYQPWLPYADTPAIEQLVLPRGVLSNWDSTLKEKIAGLPGGGFQWILGSAEQNVRKPDPAFFHLMSDCTGLEAREIAYVGDSMRLDIEPAIKLGFRAILIDRKALFPHSPLPRITSLEQLESHL
jgi:FMN phosphatase YigB (HAD superfamily)